MTTPLISDGVLINRYIDGNNAAFETLLKRHRTRILSSIYLLVGDRYLAEDIFQETFIKVIHSIQHGKYNHEDKFLPWALRIARNMSIDSIRSRKRMPVVVDTDGRDVFDAMGISVNSQEDQRVAKDEIEILKQWIWELPEDQREVLILRQYADLSFKEIAALTETNINTCIGRMHYAILNLRKKMQKSVVRIK
jgi:RNA polymerase sigma-70 factor (ECF subfamily)